MKNVGSKISKVLILAVFGVFLFANAASAHVTVVPKTSTTGAWETYTVKVPVEKEVPTAKVTLKTPAGVEIESYQPVPGWTYSADKDASGKVKSITFEAEGEGLMPGQFQQFSFVAKNPDSAGEIAWDAFQYYQDGSVVEWTGDEGAETPHSITEILAGTSTDEHADDQGVTDNTDNDAAKTADEEQSNSLPLILSIVSVILSLAALVGAFRKK
ncbi:YcnI family protein [Neobacillus muris]|uniref:YcnI family copper-binding membrane protein n=1 Tax=Neobacillus muris TaxID=2941334 RepID=UPI00203D6115|nr:DUF1775 domain-containing protein [Neobacillus muris]